MQHPSVQHTAIANTHFSPKYITSFSIKGVPVFFSKDFFLSTNLFSKNISLLPSVPQAVPTGSAVPCAPGTLHGVSCASCCCSRGRQMSAGLPRLTPQINAHPHRMSIPYPRTRLVQSIPSAPRIRARLHLSQAVSGVGPDLEVVFLIDTGADSTSLLSPDITRLGIDRCHSCSG